jgi:glycerol dehydrogenase-like iron-containing ADH family enzyme
MQPHHALLPVTARVLELAIHQQTHVQAGTLIMRGLNASCGLQAVNLLHALVQSGCCCVIVKSKTCAAAGDHLLSWLLYVCKPKLCCHS